MGRRKCLSPTSAVVAATVATTCLAPSGACTPCTLDHLRCLCIDDVVQVGTTLLEAHLIIVHGHLLDQHISLYSIIFA